MRQKTDAGYENDWEKFIGPQRDGKIIIDPSARSFKPEMVKRGMSMRR